VRLRTFGFGGTEVVGEIVNGGKEGFDVQDKFFGHVDAIEVVTAADLTEHLGNASGAALFEGAEDSPYSIDLLFNCTLLSQERLGRLGQLLVGDGVRGLLGSVSIGRYAAPAGRGELDIPKFADHVAFAGISTGE
jgi:hypothetical protein